MEIEKLKAEIEKLKEENAKLNERHKSVHNKLKELVEFQQFMDSKSDYSPDQKQYFSGVVRGYETAREVITTLYPVLPDD